MKGFMNEITKSGRRLVSAAPPTGKPLQKGNRMSRKVVEERVELLGHFIVWSRHFRLDVKIKYLKMPHETKNAYHT